MRHIPIRGCIQNDLVLAEIATLVEEAARSGATLRATPHAQRLSQTYGTFGLSKAALQERIVISAAQARVSVLLGHVGAGSVQRAYGHE